MEIVVTAVGPDNVGLADPIIHELTAQGASIAEIQMYDHDEAAVFAMMCRVNIDATRWESIRSRHAADRCEDGIVGAGVDPDAPESSRSSGHLRDLSRKYAQGRPASGCRWYHSRRCDRDDWQPEKM